MFRKRSDATLVRTLPGLRQVMPYLLPTRHGSQVFYTHTLNAEPIQAWLAERNAGRPDSERLTLLHAFLTALARLYRLRPEVNRFISGYRTYQHDEIAFTFVVKKEFSDDADVAEARVVFTGHETIEQTRDLVAAAVDRARHGEPGEDDQLIGFFARWPRPVLRTIASAIAQLDYHNALPRRLQDAIPLFTSAYVAPLGSIGLDAPLHHLYQYGTASVFFAYGRVHPEAVVDAAGQVVARDCITLSATLDERITDGFYLARSLAVFRALVEEPSLLDVPEITADQILAGPA